MKQVSVVIPVRNRPELIVRCLDSVLAQTWRPIRIIVVDNNSSDRTREAVENWAESHHVSAQDAAFTLTLLEEKKEGAAAARNRGLAAVSSSLTIFFDSDDEMTPQLVEKAVGAIGNADLVYWKGVIVGTDGKRRMKPFHSGDILRRQMYSCPLSTQLFMLRTEAIRKAGGWNESLPAWNDWELGVRLLLQGATVASLPECLTIIHAQEDSITGTDFSSRAKSLEKALDAVEEDILNARRDDSERLLDMLDYRRAVLSAHYRREGHPEMAEHLLHRSLNRSWRSPFDQGLLTLLHHYTAHGGRMAYLLWRR